MPPASEQQAQIRDARREHRSNAQVDAPCSATEPRAVVDRRVGTRASARLGLPGLPYEDSVQARPDPRPAPILQPAKPSTKGFAPGGHHHAPTVRLFTSMAGDVMRSSTTVRTLASRSS